MLFDTHCHLFDEKLFSDIQSVIEAARESDVKFFVVPAVDLETSKKVLDIAEDWNRVYPAVGIHPTIETVDFEKDIFDLEQIVERNKDKIVAIGEIGLDYYRHTLSSISQKELLSRQLKIAARYELAVIIHSRHASEDIIEVLSDNWVPSFSKRVVFHCCEPESVLLDFAKKNDVFIGVDGDVTFDKTKEEFAKKIPLELLVLETDSPYLVPNPPKGNGVRINKPENLVHIAEHISKIRDISFEKIASRTTSNAKKLFYLD